jgi:hypothetical protein
MLLTTRKTKRTTMTTMTTSYKPVNRRWLLNTIGPLWLILCIGTMGVFFLVEWVVYDCIYWWREGKTGRST